MEANDTSSRNILFIILASGYLLFRINPTAELQSVICAVARSGASEVCHASGIFSPATRTTNYISRARASKKTALPELRLCNVSLQGRSVEQPDPATQRVKVMGNLQPKSLVLVSCKEQPSISPPTSSGNK